MHGCQGACVVAEGGHVWLPGGVRGCQGGMCGEGVCVAKGGMHGEGGYAWQSGGGACVAKGGVCMARGGGMHGIRQDMEIRSMSGQYASYWNAFLC